LDRAAPGCGVVAPFAPQGSLPSRACVTASASVAGPLEPARI